MTIHKLYADCNHSWLQKELVGIQFRYCPKCFRLERYLWSIPYWENYPNIMRNEITGEVMESSGYHNIVKQFEPNHKLPVFRDFSNTCWMCGKECKEEDLAVKQKEWPEEYVNLCWPCYMGKNKEWRKGISKCLLGQHRWHPIMANPMRCYRCGFEYDNHGLGHKGSSTNEYGVPLLKIIRRVV